MNSMSGPTGRSSMGRRTGDNIPKGYAQGQLQQFTPEQMNLFKHAFSFVGPNSYLSKLAGGDQSTFDEMEAPALRQFGQAQGALASRFSGASQGELSGRRGSAFQNASGGLASEFTQDLASRRQELQRQAIMDLMGLSESLLGQRPQEKFLVQKQKKQNPWADIAGKFAGAIPGALASFANPLSGFSNIASQFTPGSMSRGYDF